MTVAVALSLAFGRDHLNPQFHAMKSAPHERLIWIYDPSSKKLAKRGDLRLFLNGKPTSFFEPGRVDMPLGIYSIEQKGQTDAYLVSTRSSNGAIMAWAQTYLYWNGKRLSLVPNGGGDPLEYHPDGRLLTIEQFDSFSAVGENETGWEQDRTASVIQRGRAILIGGAVNAWFEKDGSIRGISNGRNKSGVFGEMARPHYFTYRNGVRLDDPVWYSTLKRTEKRLYPLKGSDSRY